MAKKKLRKNSIYIKFIVPLMAVLIVLNFTIFAVIFGFSSSKLQKNETEIFSNQVTARKNYIENEMLKNWTNIYLDADEFIQTANEIASAKNITAQQILQDKTAVVELLSEMSESLFFLLRRNNVNDVFIVLDTEFESDKKYGLYLRDRNPMSLNASNTDVLIEIAPTAVRDKLFKLGLDKSTSYETKYHYGTSGDRNDFFEKPKFAAQTYPNLSRLNSGYWSADFKLHGEETETTSSFTYSVPLTDNNGAFLGVLGIGIMVDYFQSNMLPLTDFAGNGNYVLLKTDSDENFGTSVAANLSDLSVQDYQAALKSRNPETGEYSLKSADKTYFVSYVPLKLYANNTPFQNERWVLVGFIAENNLYRFTTTFSQLVIGLTILLILLSFAVFTGFSFLLTRPITKLTDKVEKLKNEKFTTVSFDKSDIYEIDTLVNEIDSLMENLLEVPQKMTQILSMTNLPIAAFEFFSKRNYFYYTDGFAELLGFDKNKEITNREFLEFTERLNERAVERTDGAVKKVIYDLSESLKPKFIEISSVDTRDGFSGVVRDITDDKLERKKLEYERDMDTLTPLMNRKGFERKLSEVFGKSEGISAMLLLDLDKLKFYNDKYGHETGDRVIMLVGDALIRHTDANCLGCHVSGDEYIMYFNGLETAELLTSRIEAVRSDLDHLYLTIDADTKLKVSVSGGYSVYPRDTDNLELMQNYADFALYEAKENRGSIVEFNAARYASDEERQKNKKILEEFIERNMADFHFQPIVDLKKNAVFAYEALIRPLREGIENPTSLLALAKENHRLNDIEKMTFFGAAEAFAERGGAALPVKLFINTISSQILDDSDISIFESTYENILKKIVLEFTEMEFMNDVVYRQRQRIIKKWHAQCALDDYGMGYSNFSMLLNKSIHYVKIDRLLIQDIHIHPHKKEIVYSLIKYCHAENIKVIAEGIEKKEELEVMLQFGVDYAQGFFLAYPQKELRGISDAAQRTIKNYRTANSDKK